MEGGVGDDEIEAVATLQSGGILSNCCEVLHRDRADRCRVLVAPRAGGLPLRQMVPGLRPHAPQASSSGRSSSVGRSRSTALNKKVLLQVSRVSVGVLL